LQLAACLRDLERATSGSRPKLILAGDVLELALAEHQVAAMVFDRFADLAFSDDSRFDDTPLYVPANHDHHLSETARERVDMGLRDVRGRRRLDEHLGEPWHASLGDD
jgi:hypothetical protein